MKIKRIILTALPSLLVAGAVFATTAFNSSQLGGSASNGFVLQTNGTVNTWVAPSTLAAASSTLLTDINTFSGASTTFNQKVNVGGTLTTQGLTVYGTLSLPASSVTNTMLQSSTISGISLGSNLAAHTVSGSLTGSSYNGSAAISDWALNMANANTWTALQTFGNINTLGATSTSLYVSASSTFAGMFNVSGMAMFSDNINSSSTATSTFAGGINVGAIGGLSSASGLTITGGQLKCTTCVPNASLVKSTISGISLGSNLASLSNDTTLSGTSYNGSGAVSNWGLNLANSNTWTASTTFSSRLNVSGGLFTDFFQASSTSATSSVAYGLLTATQGGGLTVGTTTGLAQFTYGGSVAGNEFRFACSGASVTINWNNGPKQTCTASANVTSVSLTGGNVGTTYQWDVCQDSTGNRGLTGWPGNVMFMTSVLGSATNTPGIATAANVCTRFSFTLTSATGTLNYESSLPLIGH